MIRMIIWHLGNTTVRSPFRLRDGLIALRNSKYEGNLRGEDSERAFCQVLKNASVVSLSDDVTYSIGRKWRSALNQLGFLYPRLPAKHGNTQSSLGQIDTITKNGERLISTTSVSAWQECFLRSLAAYYIPSIIENRYSCNAFSPLRLTLFVMQKLREITGDSKLNFLEMALFVQLSCNDDDLDVIVKDIINFRNMREKSKRKRKYDTDALEKAAKIYKKQSSTFKDYADTNFRYLKATGLVQSKGKGIALVPDKRVLIEKLISEEEIPDDGLSYLTNLCDGAKLPYDKMDGAKAVLEDLQKQLKDRGKKFNLINRKLDTPADMAVVRYEMQDRIAELNEEEYASQQANKIEEITEYIDLLVRNRNRKKLSNDDEIVIPKNEMPAYFEWIIWRAFLAINSLINKPWDARQFKIDQDFLPVGTAPGGRPDMVFEFDNMVLVVEVTLTRSSRQEAAEGEPVRRHVAKYAEEFKGSGKKVFGLFLAIVIDTNTANTFRLGEWYLADDNKLGLHIVPVSLEDFNKMLIAGMNTTNALLLEIKSFIENCRAIAAKNDAPSWKREISNLTDSVASKF